MTDKTGDSPAAAGRAHAFRYPERSKASCVPKWGDIGSAPGQQGRSRAAGHAGSGIGQQAIGSRDGVKLGSGPGRATDRRVLGSDPVEVFLRGVR